MCKGQYKQHKNLKLEGKCEGSACRCSYSSVCEQKKCEEYCRKTYPSKKQVHANCTNEMCHCSWKDECVLAECVKHCKSKYPKKPNLEAFCKGDFCNCKWRFLYQGP
ncbi:hypothetical protein MTO96_030561 [Rhipicephalus appendiculatus]